MDTFMRREIGLSVCCEAPRAGDALGADYECGFDPFALGEWTDDAAMAIVIAESAPRVWICVTGPHSTTWWSAPRYRRLNRTPASVQLCISCVHLRRISRERAETIDGVVGRSR